MTATLAQLVVPQDVTYYFNLLLGVYQSQGFPVQSWQTGGVERTRLLAFATALADKATNYAPTIAGGILLDYSSSDGNGGGWLPLTALEFYGVPINLATFTQGSITLTAASGVSTQTYLAGQLIATFGATGNRYINTGTVIVPNGPGSVTGTFQAEKPGSSYSDPSNSGAITLVTPIPGVTLTNPAGNYSAVSHVGSGTGTLSLSGAPIGSNLIVVRIDATATSSPTSWSYSLNGAAYVSVGTVGSAAIGSTGVMVTLVNGGAGTSFVFSDTYSFTTPGTWITQQGSNIEADLALKARCRASLPTPGAQPAPTSNYYQFLATSTPTVGSQVTQCIVQTDANINNKINIIVAGPGGVLPGATVAAIQTYINPRTIGGDYPVVTSPSTLAITYAFTVNCAANLLTSVQQSIALNLQNYTNAAGINGTLKLSDVEVLIKPNPLTGQGGITGVSDIAGVTINGVAANLTLGGVGSFVVAASGPTISATYVTT
jgi:hypothetical protein